MAEVFEFQSELTEEEFASFRTNGFLLLGRLVSDDEVATLRELYDRVLARRLGHELRATLADGTVESSYQVQVLKPEDHCPEVYDTAFFRHGRRLASQILSVSESELISHSHLTYKPPLVGRDTPWHQDEAYWFNPALKENEPRSATIWLTLDEASSSSGCMHFIPGSHERIVPHGFIDDETSGLMVLKPDSGKAQACPMSPGEASIHSSRMVHCAGPNTSTRQRRAWSLEYHAPPVPRHEPDNREWLPELERRMIARAPRGLI